jgi:hypothetical protein
MLQYDSRSGRYEGDRISVDADVFAEEIAEYQRQHPGQSYEEAEAYLSKEVNWTEDMAGVEVRQ